MLGGWGRLIVRLRWWVLLGGVAFVMVGAACGAGLTDRLSNGGFTAPDSESVHAATTIVRELGRQDIDIVVLYSATDRTVDEASFRQPVTAALDTLRSRPEVAAVVSYHDTGNQALVSTDRRSTYAAVRLATAGSREQLAAVRDSLTVRTPGISTRVGGPTAVGADVSEQVSADLARAELYSLPVLLVLLLFVFRSVVAATTPLVVGALAVFGSFIVIRGLNQVMEVSVLAINIVTLIGVGVAVDYALFVVTRFREEMATGRHAGRIPDAMAATMATAGRTVVVSGLTVALALATLLICPQPYLRSMGLGGMAAVLTAMVASLTVLPALLATVSPRIRSLAGSGTAHHRAPERGVRGWARVAAIVMRRPVAIGVVVGATLLLTVVALPLRHAQFGGVDERVLPPGSPSRTVSEFITVNFPGGRTDRINVLVTGADAAGLATLTDAVSRLPHVTAAPVTAQRNRSALVSVAYAVDTAGPEARSIVTAIRELPVPPGTEVLVGGQVAEHADLLATLADRLPWMALAAFAATFVLLFLAFGSVVLPIKAVVMNLFSIAASLGVVVWAFQYGHLSGILNFTTVGYLDASNLILMLAVLFGLSTDYEVFLLSRVREDWDRTGDNTTAVSTGLARTGRVITSAALLLIVVIGGFASGGITSIKMVGVGMVVAILIDATIVRALLVPAVMRLLGRASWWAPAGLGTVYRRYGIRETPPEPLDGAVPAESAAPTDRRTGAGRHR